MPEEYISKHLVNATINANGFLIRETALMKPMQDGCSAKNLQSISDMPAADVAEVVRCRDCCDISDMEIAPDDFCSRGVPE